MEITFKNNTPAIQPVILSENVSQMDKYFKTEKNTAASSHYAGTESRCHV